MLETAKIFSDDMVLQRDYLASIANIGEELDIHPKNKKTVGHRLMMLAKHYVYGEELPCEAHVIDKAERDRNRIVITFKNVDTSLKLSGNTVEALAVTKNGKEIAHTTVIEKYRLLIVLDEKPEGSVKVDFAQSA